MVRKVSDAAVNHRYGRYCGITKEDTVIEAAEKAIATAKAAGLSPRVIRKAKQMLEDERKRLASLH